MFEAFVEFPKPILLAINGLGVGFGCTITGLADLVFMAESAKLVPLHRFGSNRRGSKYGDLPVIMGPQNANWCC